MQQTPQTTHIEQLDIGSAQGFSSVTETSFSMIEEQRPCPRVIRRNLDKEKTFRDLYNYQSPRSALAMFEVDDWEIHPININIGKLIGQGFWGKVHKALVRSMAIRKLSNVIPGLAKDQYRFAAVKILKGMSSSYMIQD